MEGWWRTEGWKGGEGLRGVWACVCVVCGCVCVCVCVCVIQYMHVILCCLFAKLVKHGVRTLPG